MENDDLTTAIPVRFFDSDKAIADDMARRSKLPVATIIRLATHYALPKFASGEVNIFELVAAEPAQPASNPADRVAFGHPKPMPAGMGSTPATFRPTDADVVP